MHVLSCLLKYGAVLTAVGFLFYFGYPFLREGDIKRQVRALSQMDISDYEILNSSDEDNGFMGDSSSSRLYVAQKDPELFDGNCPNKNFSYEILELDYPWNKYFPSNVPVCRYYKSTRDDVWVVIQHGRYVYYSHYIL